MRMAYCIAIIALFVSCGTVHGGPVLLGSISNSWQGTDPATRETAEMGDRLLYTVIGDPRSGDLFENNRVTVQRDAPPVVVDESLVFGDDPDFAVIAELLTDGLSMGNPDGTAIQEISVLGMIGESEAIIDVLVPRISEFDLFGYEVERIDRHVAFSIISPGGIPGTEGTVFRIDGVYEFWGQPIPEPTTLGLLGAGIVFGLIRRV